MDVDVRSVSADLLAQQCADKPLRPAHRLPQSSATSIDDFCFELIRRAFESRDGYCLGLVLDLYKRIWSRRWIRDPQAFESSPLTVDDFTSISFANVYRRYNGEAFRAFSSFGAFLAYLHRAMVREVAGQNRTATTRLVIKLGANDPDDQDALERLPATQNVQQDVERKLLWQSVEEQIARLVSDPVERHIFDSWAKYDMSRAAITAEVNARWPDANVNADRVRVILQRIRRRLISDPKLQQRLGAFQGEQDTFNIDEN